MTIKELEKRSGLKRTTIHYYVRNGLLHEPHREAQTKANYDESHLRRLELIQKIKRQFLKTARTTRVPLDFIKRNLDDEVNPPVQSLPPAKKQHDRRITGKEFKKKQDILEITLELYTKKGYHRTTIHDIIKKVGISTPTFYHYFPDKRDLFFQMIEYVIKRWREETAATLRSESNLAKIGLILFRVFKENYSKIGEVLNQLKAGAAVGDQWARDRMIHVYNELMEDAKTLIKYGNKKGVFRKMNPELLSYYLVMIDEMTIQYSNLYNKYPAKEVVEFITDMIAHGFLTKKGQMDLEAFRKKYGSD